MRIISGKFKGKKILTPIDKNTRPLKDLTKESIFNIITHSKKININLENSNVLDLFSGVGSFGIECISRGAQKVTFVENYHNVLPILKKNLDNLKSEINYEIFQNDIYQNFKIEKLKDDNLIFTLFDGFKLVVNNNEIEKLKFDNYKIEFPNIIKKEYQNFDKNTIGLNILIKEFSEENIKIITQRIFDLLLIISFILYFYLFIIKTNDFRLKNFFLFIILSIIILTIDNFVENIKLDNITINIFYILNIISIHLIGYILEKFKYYE